MSIAANIDSIEERIQAACRRSGRKREEVRLMGVSKLQPLSAVDEAWKAGLRLFGESRVQEAVAKFAAAKYANAAYPGMELHMVGVLQRNKVKAAISLFDCIQSLDRESLAAELVKCLAEQTARPGSPLPVLLELRTGEDSKSGFSDFDSLFRVTELVLSCPSLSVQGLMTIAPNVDDAKLLRKAFRLVIEAQKELEKRFPLRVSCLSMGMSGDFEIAVEEGSTLLRIGDAIFGGNN